MAASASSSASPGFAARSAAPPVTLTANGARSGGTGVRSTRTASVSRRAVSTCAGCCARRDVGQSVTANTAAPTDLGTKKRMGMDVGIGREPLLPSRCKSCANTAEWSAAVADDRAHMKERAAV